MVVISLCYMYVTLLPSMVDKMSTTHLLPKKKAFRMTSYQP